MLFLRRVCIVLVAALEGPAPWADAVEFQEIDQVDLFSGAPLHIGLDGFDTDGQDLTFSVSSDDPSLVSPSILAGNRSLRMVVSDYGEMVFELFEHRVPRVTDTIIGLAGSGTYDGTIYHRIIETFMIQGGDPTGTGLGDPLIPDFDDQFNVQLQHTGAGVLSMAKSGDDTNSSQFFITAGPTRHLDFNHSVFGQLTDGEDVRSAISQVATGASDRPLTDVVLERVDIFADHENATLMLAAPEGATGQTDITVLASSPSGESFSQTFSVTVQPDPFNGGPFLGELPPTVSTTVEQPIEILLSGVDPEGDSMVYDAARAGGAEFDWLIDNAPTTDDVVVLVTPPDGFVGTLDLLVGVRPELRSNTGDGLDWDTQVLEIVVDPPPALQAGDSDQDLDFDQFDLIKVQIAGKYLTGQSATWGDGDWNGAPGGEPGNPPAGDGRFDQLDIIAALGANQYLTGPYAGLAPGGVNAPALLSGAGTDRVHAAVPEPATVVLLVMGLIGFLSGRLGSVRPSCFVNA